MKKFDLFFAILILVYGSLAAYGALRQGRFFDGFSYFAVSFTLFHFIKNYR